MNKTEVKSESDGIAEKIGEGILPKEAVIKVKTKTCFIVTPIGADNSNIRRAADGVIDSAIEPVLREFNYMCKVAHRVNQQGLITAQVINDVVESELVIANLTELNPNVMYELALRHCTDKPIIHICEKGTILPFDIKDQRTIMYENDMLGVKELKENLKKYIEEINESFEENSNIITFVRQQKILIDNIGSEEDSGMLKIILNEIRKNNGGYNSMKKEFLNVPQICEKYNILDSSINYWYFAKERGISKMNGDNFIEESLKLYGSDKLLFLNLDQEDVVCLQTRISIDERLNIDKIAEKYGFRIAGR